MDRRGPDAGGETGRDLQLFDGAEKKAQWWPGVICWSPESKSLSLFDTFEIEIVSLFPVSLFAIYASIPFPTGL
jgi:hypothetical protein